MITRKFIETIRAYFDELGIDAKNGITEDEFEQAFTKTLNRCEDIADAKIAISIFRYCTKKWKKIEKMFLKHLQRWQEYNFEGSSLNLVEDDDALGGYYITNALTNDYKDVVLTSASFDDEVYQFNYEHGKFMLNEDYYVKYSKTDPDIMKLFDKNDNKLCDIVLSKNFEIFLDKNLTKYHLVINEEAESPFVGIFEKSYIDGLKETDYIDFKNMIADIEWDLLNKKSNLGIARLNLYKDVNDDIIFYFAAATFLLFASYKKYKNSLNAINFMNINNMINS